MNPDETERALDHIGVTQSGPPAIDQAIHDKSIPPTRVELEASLRLLTGNFSRDNSPEVTS